MEMLSSVEKQSAGGSERFSLIFLNPEKGKTFSFWVLYRHRRFERRVVVAITILSQATLSWIQPLEIITHTIIWMIPI